MCQENGKNISMFKNYIDKSFLIFLIIFTFLSFFLFLENYNFLNDKSSLLFDIDPNPSVGDSYKYYQQAIINDFNFFELALQYLNNFSVNYDHYQGARFYPVNDLQHFFYYSVFGNNFFVYSLFNYLFYVFLIYKIFNLIPKNKKKIYLFLNLINFLIIGSLSSLNKEIICVFSFTLFLIYYLNKQKIFLILSLVFGVFSRYEYLIILILIVIINSSLIKSMISSIREKFKLHEKFKRYNFFIFFFVSSLFGYFSIAFLITIFNLIFKIDFINLIDGGRYSGIIYQNIFFDLINFIKYYTIITIFTLLGKFFFSKSYKENNYLIIILSLIILMLNEILPNYPWFVEQIIDITYQQTDKSIGLTLFLYEEVMDGFYFLIFPMKIASSLFAGAFQKPLLVSYESIFNYFSQIIFFILSINIFYNFFKNKYSEYLILFFIGSVFLIIFSLPPISQHRYVFFLYQLFVLLVCLNKTKYKRMNF